jgi:hypothetical protein
VDTLPAFAYTALGEDAMKRGETDDAYTRFETARRIVEDYSRTTPQYQISEIATLGSNAPARRAEVRNLYTERILPGYRAALKKLGKPIPDTLSSDESATLARLDAFLTPESLNPAQ